MAANPMDVKAECLSDIAHKMSCIERFAERSGRKRQIADARKAVGQMPTMSLEQLQLLQTSLRVLDQQLEAEAMFP